MGSACLVCGETFSDISYHKHYDEHQRILNAANKEQVKMTREEALSKLKTIKTPLSVENIVDILEEVGVLEFEEEKKINVLFNYGVNASDYYDQDTPINKVVKQYGTIRLEEWPEGLVLWVGVEIKWKSWVDYYKKGDAVTIEFYEGLIRTKLTQAGIISR